MQPAVQRCLLFVCILCSFSASEASPYLVEGLFSSPTTRLQLLVLDGRTGVLAASSTVVQGGCSGSISGIGQMVGTVLTFVPYVAEEGGERCQVTVNFNAAFTSATISEEGCSAYHGAACGWEGQSVHKRHR